MIQKDTYEFLKALALNNNREWFAENKAWYDRARADFESFVGEVIKATAVFDPEISYLEPKKCIFRIYRDTRFSKDKTPYKNHFGAVLSPEDMNKSSGYYIHIQPDESFISCGHYMLLPDQLKIVRTGIYEDFDNFQAIINEKRLKKIVGDLCQDDQLQRVPPGFDKEHPAAAYMKLKHFYVMKKLPEKELFSNQLTKHVTEVFQIMEPLNKYLNQLLRNK